MKDFLGNGLSVGDKVVCIELGYKNLRKGTVTKITPKTCQVEYQKHNYTESVKRFSDQVIKI